MIELLVLGIINRAGSPISGYMLKKQLRDHHVGEYADVSYGAIYYHLKQMEQDALICGNSVKDSGRPERRLYCLTEKGSARLAELLRHNFSEIERHCHSFDVGVGMMWLMPREEVLVALDKRISIYLEFLRTHRQEREQLRKYPFFVGAILDHSLYYFEAEIKWLKELRHSVEASKDWGEGINRFEDNEGMEQKDESD